MNYYNDNDKFNCAWLREIIKRGHIAPGEVDERDINLVQPEDLKGYVQCHFFAGIGGWSAALRLAGWPDDRPVWTGSCPCQPFSSAGKRRGTTDPRHLWPAWQRLIAQCRPATIFGEQVAGQDGVEWLDLVSVDLERMGYAFGAADMCAASVGAPHPRQRLWFVADHTEHGWRQRRAEGRRCVSGSATQSERARPLHGGATDDLADAKHDRRRERSANGGQEARQGAGVESGSEVNGIGDADESGKNGRPSIASNPWSDFDIIPCTDGKARLVEPGTFPLAHGVPARMGRLRGYGNTIVPQVAAEFIKAFVETAEDTDYTDFHGTRETKRNGVRRDA